MPLIRRWTDITPAEAVEKKLDLARDLHITAPLNEAGERCPWPWEPQQLAGAPLGQFHCSYCGAMCVAGVPHPDYAPDERVVTEEDLASLFEWCEGSKLRYADVGGRLQVVGLTVLVGGERVPAFFGDTIVDDCGLFSVRKTAADVPSLPGGPVQPAEVCRGGPYGAPGSLA